MRLPWASGGVTGREHGRGRKHVQGKGRKQGPPQARPGPHLGPAGCSWSTVGERHAEAVAWLLQPAECSEAAGAAGAAAGQVLTLGAEQDGAACTGSDCCQVPRKGAGAPQPCSSARAPQPLSQLSAPLSSWRRVSRGADADAGPRPGPLPAGDGGVGAHRGSTVVRLASLKGDADTGTPCCWSVTWCATALLRPIVAARRRAGDGAAAGCCTLGGWGCNGCCWGCWLGGAQSPGVQEGGREGG